MTPAPHDDLVGRLEKSAIDDEGMAAADINWHGETTRTDDAKLKREAAARIAELEAKVAKMMQPITVTGAQTLRLTWDNGFDCWMLVDALTKDKNAD